MISPILEKTALASDRDALFLYAAAFLLAFGGGHWWLARRNGI